MLTRFVTAPSAKRIEPHVAVTATRSRERHFRIGVVSVSVRSDYAPALRDLSRLYEGYELAEAPGDAIKIDIVRTRHGRSLRRRYEIWADGAMRFMVWQGNDVLPHVEWAINWQLMLYLPRFFEIHASVVEIDGEGVMFPAAPQSGKSTLALGLLSRGARYLSDEFALIDPETLRLHPYPKALCLKEGSFGVLDDLGLHRERRRVYVKGKKGRVAFVSPTRFGPERVGSPCPVRHILFCRYREGARPAVSSISRAEAVLRLNEQSFNFLKFRRRGVTLMSDLVRSATCYELTAGDIEPTCDLVESLVRKTGARHACECDTPVKCNA